ncbi:(2Fe-2S)-binding protein [Magnetospirillum sulfuroxidans]|uniref:Bacterioferritin-associated ferredoxin n=1 Tax=Magnetospirillum sulfuroxidans TaxID=611300 RepID=A0ABS5ID44_9PROT|nr:(2Fe-2S)-binding protein [Magnetospirillum sulfuroxidans]MBR9972344.1 (2Fe-2S)-binding protein [Magnetospirillum sulfuroxidans]
MYVCVCNAITDREVHAAMAGGAIVADEVFRHFGTQMRCGRCVATMRSLMGDNAMSGERRHVSDTEPASTHKRCRGCTR